MTQDRQGHTGVLDDVISYYESTGCEVGRLKEGEGRLEFARTRDILQRYLPPAPAVVLDVGGGSGVYACWLAREGHEVHLVDAVPGHVELARRASEAQPECPIASVRVGDARRLERADESVDAVLLLGPLYHLTERGDRIAALQEARRVLKPGGRAFIAAISRFASLLDGLRMGYLDDPTFARIVERDLQDGQHANPTGEPRYFTSAHFHRPETLKREIEEAGLLYGKILAVEGPGWLMPEIHRRWDDPDWRGRLLDAIRSIEEEPSLLGVSAHILAVTAKR